jgi:hypothetical protein
MARNLRPANISEPSHRRTDSRVRQLGSSAQSDNHQNQILSALDTLGAKLVRSEGERETMRKLLNDALDTQEKLENQLERSQINIFQRLDSIENKNEGLSAEDKNFIEEQKKSIVETEELLESHRKRQQRVEDKLRDSQQTIQKLQRRLDTQEQKRVKLQRRIERVENIAADAQNALEAKAMVLLTDQSENVRLLEQQMAEQKIRLNQYADQPTQADIIHGDDGNKKPFGWTKYSTSLLTILAAVGFGWMMSSATNTNPQAFMVTESGNIEQISLQESNASPITSQSPSIEADIAAFETDWISESIVDSALDEMSAQSNVSEYDVLQTVTDLSVTMDRDPSLPDQIKELETKAFDGVAEAQHDLAALYTAGEGGVSQNYERAGFWFRQAADQGIANATYNLGVLNQQGLGQSQDIQRALDWYRRAAQLGHPEAQYNLGIAYIEGVGTRYNPSMAAAFFQQAAFGGIVEAAYNLGLILENGLLGETRPEDAMIWYRGAAESGSLDAQQALKNLAEAMNIPFDAAGLLQNGESIAKFINPSLNIDGDLFADAKEDISLGTLVPTQEQILVAQIQEQLRKARLYNGPQDGIAGSGTVRAIRTYQRQNDIPANGVADQDLLTFMLQQGTMD